MTETVILDTGVVECLWTGGEGTSWLEAVIDGDGTAVVSAATVAEAVRRAPDRRAEIQFEALLDFVDVLDLSARSRDGRGRSYVNSIHPIRKQC